MTRTFHLAPRQVWETQQSGATYTPEQFPVEGFIHCTDGEASVIAVGNRYYRADPREMVCLSIDCDLVQAPIRYEDAERIYPHIYGPLNLDAVSAVRQVVRAGDGQFLRLGFDLPA
jgi:uncharacterized protein (DUF952 family)